MRKIDGKLVGSWQRFWTTTSLSCPQSSTLSFAEAQLFLNKGGEMKHKEGCKAEYYRRVKRTPESVSHHKCICAECGIELNPITLEPEETKETKG